MIDAEGNGSGEKNYLAISKKITWERKEKE